MNKEKVYRVEFGNYIILKHGVHWIIYDHNGNPITHSPRLSDCMIFLELIHTNYPPDEKERLTNIYFHDKI